MTAKKPKIIGPYTPEHSGPFCTRSGRPARIICTDRSGDWPLVVLVKAGVHEDIHLYASNGRYGASGDKPNDLMNAEEAPVAREFWVNEFTHGSVLTFNTEEIAKEYEGRPNFIRTIHVREVLEEENENA